MEKRINIANLLKDCPKGMELDCIIYKDVTLMDVDCSCYPIQVQTPEGNLHLSKYGCMSLSEHAKCVIYPKGKTTWEGFVPPCQFNDGDILATDLGSVFFLNTHLNTDEYYGCYVGIGGDGSFHICEPFAYKECCGLATEEEKAKLFQAIKDNGYRWNAETKTLGKLIEPKFKVGDKIKYKGDNAIGRIEKIEGNVYHVDYGYDDGIIRVNLNMQDDYELVHDKFDINTLKPFESKVLVRDSEAEKWIPAIWGYYESDSKYNYPYEVVGGHGFSMCIPYEGNSHLMGKTDDCDEFYKTWE